MSDRLDEFRRQRTLLREHLAWLDREIAGLEGGAPPAPGAAQPAAAAVPPVVDAEAEAILAEYRRPSVSIQKQAKAGCLLYFFAALALMALAAVLLYVLFKRAHGH
ncbi:MAG TPA: hypothetical protein VN775_00875 [Opitutaceae bacterium]|nr:hypothetical protein [Opitutaceae bacterium]